VKRSCPSCGPEPGGEEKKGRRNPISVHLFPPELVEHIISFLPVRDVVALGQTCRYFHEVCDAEGVWRRICRRLSPRLREQGSGVRPWKRAAILNYTKGLYFQAFGGRRRCLSKSVAPLLAHGYRRFLPTKDHVFILDYAGTLFFLKNALVSSTLGQIQWKRACRYVVLCRGAKDFASDPRCDTVYRKYLYVLATREQLGVVGSTGSRACDCVEVYLQSSGQRVFKMTFHHSMSFKQIVLVGQETQRALLLLTVVFKLFPADSSGSVAGGGEGSLPDRALRTTSSWIQTISTFSCLLHSALSTLGSLLPAFLSPLAFQPLPLGCWERGNKWEKSPLGTRPGIAPIKPNQTRCLELPYSVSKGQVVDSNCLRFVNVFPLNLAGRMRGWTQWAQAGEDEGTVRGCRSGVPYLQRPIALWCGLNHSLVLSQGSDFSKELLGCGCGAGGRLPGWPKGSASFVKLHVKVPLCACSLCSTRECLYMLSSHDIEHHLAYRDLPASRVVGTPELSLGAGLPQDPRGAA
uniref:F-box protein 24 n=1 Tax=Loxodonta africana TaxID=9785 RepID=G3U4U0_LOXAF